LTTTIRAELILYYGTIHTMDPLHPTAEAVAVAGGRIIAVGQLEEIEATTHANTKRIDLAGRTLIPGFNDAHVNLYKAGLQLNGIAEETANASDLETAILAAAKAYLRLGITSVTEAGLPPTLLDSYRKLADERRLPFRINAMALRYAADGSKIHLPERFESNWLRIDTVLIFADRPDHEGLLYTDDQMRALIWDIHRGGLRAAIQATSEAAIAQVIGAIEYASQRLVSRLKHRIEGFAQPTADHIRRSSHRIGVVIQPTAIMDNANSDHLLRSMLDFGLTVAFGSGAPQLSDTNPLQGIKVASERAISVAESLSLYTLGGAVVAGEDQLKGSISPGKYADLTILSGDPLRAPLARLTDLQVETVLVNGLVVYSA
jgi:predicted amidohydrolase YtcJ